MSTTVQPAPGAETAPINLFKKLPEVTFLNGTTHQLACFNAETYRKYRAFSTLVRRSLQSENASIEDEERAEDMQDELLALVFPSATVDDLAGFGCDKQTRGMLVNAAGGQLEAVLALMELDRPKVAAPEAAPSPLATTSETP